MEANTLRGEAPLRIGDVDLVIAVEFDRLAKLSSMVGCQGIGELYRRMLDFEPKTVACAIKALAIHSGGSEKADELALSAIPKLSGADEQAWREAIRIALTAHIDAGRKLRGEKTLAEAVLDIEKATEGLTPGKTESPS